MNTHTLTLGQGSTLFPTQAHLHPLAGHPYSNTLTHILYDTPSCTLAHTQLQIHMHTHFNSLTYTCSLTSISQPTHSLTHSPRSLAWQSRIGWLLTHSPWAQIQTHKQPHSHPLTSIAPTPTFFREVHYSWGQDRHLKIILLLHYSGKAGGGGQFIKFGTALLWGNSQEERTLI